MPSIFDTITQELGGANLTQLSQQIGADEATTSQAIQARSRCYSAASRATHRIPPALTHSTQR